MIRFIHTADSHFGVENYGKIDQKMGIHTRLLDFDRAFQTCVAYAIQQNVDFFLFCGDAYKTATPTPTQQKLLLCNFLKLYKAGIPVVIIVGNHDHPVSFGKIHALDIFSDLPVDGFHVISKPTTITLSTKNGPVSIVGIPWPTRNIIALNTHILSSDQVTQHIAKSVGSIIHSLAQELDSTIPSILAGHLCVSSGVFSGSEKRAIYGQDPLLLPSQLAIKPFDYVALGHLHRHQNLNQAGYPAIVYSGSLERLDFGERNEEKGFCDVRILDKNTTEYTFIPISTRRFIQIEATLNAAENEDHTIHILNELKKHVITEAIVKIIYHVPTGCKDRVNLKTIQNACESAHYLAGIQAVRAIEHKERTNQTPLETDLNTLLLHYFKQKPEWHDKTDRLIQKIALIKHACDQLNNE